MVEYGQQRERVTDQNVEAKECGEADEQEDKGTS
jgi:hypothetical protein